ncbi:hypothetical protein SORBI_3001G326700 [Sorghum bicolor]|uniref:F-box domain-containing protein n=2 Tax=Sorghum bicolor TaxID=4558 RepID=A0A1Z5S8Q3_SORBI|nr:hypothetical protein SORBI_3001G326700 [Sorghum bicolor]
MEEARDTKKKRSLAVTSSASTAAATGVGLTDDHIVDILSRVPVKSICRFKCVSPSWRSLISHPDNRKKLPQTVTGFFYFDEFDSCTFVSLLAEPPRRTTGRGWVRPRSPCDFLPANTGGGVVDCCNGLVLLNNSRGGGGGGGSEPRASYVVCNPATEKWTTVPASTRAGKICSASILCFDPAISPHFHVVQLLDRDPEADEADDEEEEDWFAEESSQFEGFNIYSSETGAWVFHPHDSHWSPVAHRSRRIFFNGQLHFVTGDDGAVAALDMKGQQKRRVIPVPRSGEVQLIGHSQGRLLYANRDARNASKLSIYVLGEGGNGNGRWTLKHCVETSSGLFAGEEYLQSGLLVGVAAIHPHGDSVFLFDSLQGRLMSYGMGSRRGHVVGNVEESPLWSFVPYVPLYLEMAALENSKN